jgi:hypothetical protein
MPPSLRLRQIVSLALCFAVVTTGLFGQAKPSPQPDQNLPEMLLTDEGLLAINAPNGWIRTRGPGLAFFVHEHDTDQTARVWIYISSAPIGPQEAKNLEEYIESDIAGFKQRFKSGVVRKETPIELPLSKSKAPVYTFLSGESHNAFEQIIYVVDGYRILILALSATDKIAFERSRSDFHTFAKSYRGSVTPSTPEK